ncbi:MAG TPA: sulfite exporter TauE/SafE family protein [Acidimicrobiales bacterium]|nr:sulfite exporter TauE/SafE family protein [Acidimicrobiales bacterium]
MDTPHVGYFGAGSGVMVLALLGVALDETLARANALKNVLLGAADVVVAGGFLLFGPVRLAPALWLGVGLLAGSALGPSITRRAPEAPVRGVVAALGAGLAFWLLAHPG